MPRSGPPGPPPGRPQRPVPTDLYDDEAEEFEDFEESPTSRLAGWLSTLGVGLVAVIATQVVLAILEGLSARVSELEPNGIETDLLHRLGFPFGSMGALAELFLVVALALIALPVLLGEETGRTQDRMVNVALVAIVGLAAIVGIGSALAVRYQLYQYTAQGLTAPNFARIGFAVFLLGALGTAAVAVFGAIATLKVRKRLTG